MLRNYKICILSIMFLLILTGCEGGLEELGFGPSSSKIDDYDEIIAFYGNKYKIPVDFINAVIETESAWDKDAVSPAGAKGLMQLMPGTAKMLGVKNSFDPKQNIAGGTKYLRMLLDKFDGDYELALAGYNAGPRTVEHYKGIPPYKETINYVDKVMTLYRRSSKKL